jgi:hypothetical protein
MMEALAREAAPAALPPRAQRASGIVEVPIVHDKSKFWEWIKAAF